MLASLLEQSGMLLGHVGAVVLVAVGVALGREGEPLLGGATAVLGVVLFYVRHAVLE